MNKLIVIVIFLTLSTITLNTNAFAIHFVRTKVCGEIKSIDKDEKTITFNRPPTEKTLVLKVGKLTRFIKDDREISFEDVLIGQKGEVTYKSPLFTERYLVIFRWSESGKLESKLNC